MGSRWHNIIGLSGLLIVACAQEQATPSPSATPATAASEAPLETHSQNPWIKQRIQALADLYPISPAGRTWLEGYDLRQVMARPGWFGSFGNESWTGVGQAIPSSILHELSHSYYGAFPVSGHAQLSWERGPGDNLSPALRQYQKDLITFMSQPPDSYEPLRQRFRNLPNLSKEENPDLFHFGEADLLFTTGGNLGLMPPILRKYFDRFLQEGRFETWDEALAWYLGLPDQVKRLADGYIGIAHFPLHRYRDLKPRGPTELPEGIVSALRREEVQRLTDFALQFDAILATEFRSADAASVDGSFQFWRGYLKQILELHKKHPLVLADVGGKGPQLREALDAFMNTERLAVDEQVRFFEERLRDPFLMNFSVLLPSPVLIELLGRLAEEHPLKSVEGVIGRFARTLDDYSSKVNAALSSGREGSRKGLDALEAFLDSLSDSQHERHLGLIFELMRGADGTTAERLVERLSDDLILRMLRNNPGALLNGNISPDRLLNALDVTPRNTPAEIVGGLKTLDQYGSGNRQIDNPFSRLSYSVISVVAEIDSRTALTMLREAEIPLVQFIRSFPEASVGILSSEPSEGARLITNPRGYAHSPAHIVHTLISVDAHLAATTVIELEEQGREDLAAESLIVFAFDATRLKSNPSLEVSLAADKEFLEHLTILRGPEWVTRHMSGALNKYHQEVLQGRIDECFVEEYRATLREIIDLVEKGSSRRAFERMINEAFQEAGHSPPVNAGGLVGLSAQTAGCPRGQAE